MSETNIVKSLQNVITNPGSNLTNSTLESSGFLNIFLESLEQTPENKVVDFDVIIDNTLQSSDSTGMSIIEMQELDQNGLLFNQSQFESPQDTLISSHQITLEKLPQDIIGSDLDKIEDLTLKVSSQPWIISPNLDRYDARNSYCYSNYETQDDITSFYVNTNFLVANDTERFTDKDLFENINDSFYLNQKGESQDLNIKQLEVKQCEYVISEQVVQEYNSCELKLQDSVVDNHGISKYESLSNAVKKQIINSIAIQKVNDKDTIEISLYPKDLGHVKIKYDIHDNVAINISVEKLTTLALLQQNASEIKEVLLKNLNNNFAPDLSFNMGNKSQDNDQNATHSTSLVERINNSKVLEVPNALMYLMHNGKINFVV